MNSFNKHFFIVVLSLFCNMTLFSAETIDETFMTDFWNAFVDSNVAKVKALVNQAGNQKLTQKITYEIDDISGTFAWQNGYFLDFEYQQENDWHCKSALDMALDCYSLSKTQENKTKALELINFFLSNNVDPNRPNHKGDTLLFQIIKNKNLIIAEQIKLITLLFEQKPDLDLTIKDKNDDTFLHLIIKDTELTSADRLELLKLLFKHRPDLDLTIPDGTGFTALERALLFNQIEVITFLRSKGATIDDKLKEQLLVLGKGAAHKALTDPLPQDKVLEPSVLDKAGEYKYQILGITCCGIALVVLPRLHRLWKKHKQKKEKERRLKKANTKQNEPNENAAQTTESWE
jgi:ankyrin repeat protein